MHQVFLLLGSNLGNRLGYLNLAIDNIEKNIARILKTSSVYETQSWGKTDAPHYLNQVIWLETHLAPRVLLKRILAIENLLGRHRVEKWGSRTIDIDILFYGHQVVDEPGLQIPHPAMHKRRFTLEPMAEVAPGWIHPGLNKNILQLKTELIDSLTVKSYNFEITDRFMPQNSIPQDLDLSMLNEIADGSNEFLIESIDMFLEHTPDLSRTIAAGIAAGDWVLVSGAAHKLKPNLGFFGMPVSQALMQEIELMAKNNAPDTGLLQSKFDEVQEIITENLESLKKIRADLQSGV